MYYTIIELIKLYITELTTTLADTQRKLKSLSAYCDLYLTTCIVHGNTYYYCRKKGQSAKQYNKYLGSINNLEVKRIMLAKHLKKRESVLMRNIKLAEELLSGSSPYDLIFIHDQLSKVYKAMSIQAKNTQATPEDIKHWMERLLQLKKEHPPKHPENLTVPTDCGILVRSKSEQVIANMLFNLGIPFVYEAPLLLRGRWYHPDFTIMIPKTRNVYYIEHFGNMADESYAINHGLKLRAYISEKIMPDEQLITSYEGLDGRTFNSQILRKKLLSLLNEETQLSKQSNYFAAS